MDGLEDLTEQEIVNLLPKGFADIVAHILSIDGIIWLIEAFGGVSVYIPEQTKFAEKRLHGLSQSEISSFCQAGGGAYLSVPMAQKLRTELMRRRIKKLRETGMSNFAIARECNIHERSVRRVTRLMKNAHDIKQTKIET